MVTSDPVHGAIFLSMTFVSLILGPLVLLQGSSYLSETLIPTFYSDPIKGTQMISDISQMLTFEDLRY